MLATAVEIVHDDPVARPDERHAAAMPDRIAEPAVAVVLGRDARQLGGRHVSHEPRLRERSPRERTGRLRLRQVVDQHRAVRSCRPEAFAPAGVGGVAVRPTVHQVRRSEDGALDGEPHVHVVQRRVPRVQHEDVVAERGSSEDGQPAGLPRDQRVAEQAHLDVPGLHGGEDRALVGDDAELDAVELDLA